MFLLSCTHFHIVPQAGMTGIDEKTCALIVEEVTLPQVQQFAETLEA
jgi:hypothetical protein